MSVAFARAALLEQSAALNIYFFDPALTCQDASAQEPRPPAISGPFQELLNDNARKNGVTLTVPNIPVGTYLVMVDAVDGSGRVIGTGCAASQKILSRKTTPIRITIS
jgi:hypothetical protein